jgi:hypothetical protein
MGKFKELRDELNQVDHQHGQTAKTFAAKLNQHARKASADLDRESKRIAQRIVKLEKRVANLERRQRKGK